MTNQPASALEDTPGSGWALVRADGVIAAADAGFASCFGTTLATELVGRSWRDLVTPDGQRTLAEIERSVRAGRPWQGKLEARAASGPVDLEVEARPSGRDAAVALRVRARPPAPAPALEATRPEAGVPRGDVPAVDAPDFETLAADRAPVDVASVGAAEAPAPPATPAIDDNARPPSDVAQPAAPRATEGAPPAIEPRPAASTPPLASAAAVVSSPSRTRRDALAAAARALGFDWAVVLRATGAGAVEVLETYPEALAGVEAGVRWSLPDDAERAVLESGEPAITKALAVRRGDISPLARLPSYGLRSAVRVPLFAAGEVAGVVAAYSTRPAAFTIEDALRLERAVRGLLGNRATTPLEVRTALEDAPSPAGVPEPYPPPSEPPPAPSMAEQFDRLGTLGEVMAGVAHELNNPLTAVVGYAQALRSLPAAEQTRALEVIEREALRAGRIVRTLLAFAQRHPPELSAVDLNAVVQRVLDLKRYALQMDNIAIEVERAPLPDLRADEHQLEQALLNLVNNAHQAMAPAGGTLRIRTLFEGRHARVVVEDTGPGVPPELASRVFDPFFTTREVGGGMGLGLAVVFGTVSAHGGRVWVERAPSGGARFVIELPLAAAPDGGEEPAAEPRPPEASAGPPRGSGQRVLIVDDEEPIRTLASQVLASFGYEPSTAASGIEAISILEQQPIEAVLTDVRMPGMDGIALYREVARRWPALADRVVIMTGDLENEAVAELLRERGLGSLEKPFRLEDLLSALATAVAPR